MIVGNGLLTNDHPLPQCQGGVEGEARHVDRLVLVLLDWTRTGREGMEMETLWRLG